MMVISDTLNDGVNWNINFGKSIVFQGLNML